MAEAKLTLTAVDQTRQAFDSVKRNLGEMERAATSFRSVVAGLGVGLSAGALVGFVRTAVDAADNLGKMAQRVGVTVEALSELEYAGKLADVSTEQLGDGLRKLAVNLQGARSGSKELQAAFQSVGIAQAELGSLGADQALARIADAFSSAEDGAGKTAIAVKLLGRAGSDFIPLLNQGSAGLRSAADEARRFGLVVSNDTARAAETFNDNLTRLGASLSGVGTTLANVVLPSFVEMSEAMAKASRDGGVLFGVLKGIATAGKITIFGTDPGEIQKQRAFIQEIKGEIAAIQKSAQGNGSFGSGLLDQLVFGDAKEKQRKLAELKITLAQAEQALQRMQEAGKAATAEQAPRRALSLPEVPKSMTDAVADLERGAQRAATFMVNVYTQQFDRLRAEAQQVNSDLVAILQQGPDEAARQAQQRAASIESLLGQTQIGRVEQLQRSLEDLAAAGARAPADMQEKFAQAFEIINTEIQRTKGNLEKLPEAMDDFEKYLKRLESAIERWGDASADEIVKFVKTGKVEIASLVDTILTDFLRLYIQQTVTRPLFSAFAGAIGVGGAGAGGGGGGIPIGGQRALGGPVSSGTAYLVGERGPELFIPSSNGGIVPNNRLGGVVLQQTNYIDSRSDVNSVRQAVYQASALAQAEMARMNRKG